MAWIIINEFTITLGNLISLTTRIFSIIYGMNYQTNEKITILQGYDNRSTVYDMGDHILRRFDIQYFDEIETIYNSYKKYDLHQYGIVTTDIDQSSNSIRHEKHIISYPYEWTANMYKDAVIYHLQLFSELDRFCLTLKDALPNNIVFDKCKPVFIDFSSLVEKNKLSEEEWLVEKSYYSDPRFAIVDRMLTPFMLIPLMALANKDYKAARRMLSEKACNCRDSPPKWRDLYFNSKFFFFNRRNLILCFCWLAHNLRVKISPCNRNKQLFAVQNYLHKQSEVEFKEFVSVLKNYATDLNVTPPRSAYLPYYEKKNEDLDFDDRAEWDVKQTNIFKILKDSSPKTVLDIGANTGWFSILSAKLGADVIATDIDESSIDSLYLYAKQNDQSILPLCMSFDDLTREIYGIDCQDPIYKDRNFKSTPLFLPATQRLKADLVLCLGLIHHLVLGMGKKLEDIMKVLAKLTADHLVLEFISFDDKLIQDEPSFFGNINNFSKDTYNLVIIVDEGKRFFKSVQVMDSENETRKLLLFKQ
jgi:SAM-dependent methyltransferase